MLFIVQSLSHVRLCDPRDSSTSFLHPPLSPGVCSNSCPLSWGCYLTISFFTALFFSLQTFSASGSFPMSQLLPSGGRGTGASASASVLPMNILCWFPSVLTGLISLQSKGLSRVFSNTTVWKHQFFSIPPSLWANSHICPWLPLNGERSAPLQVQHSFWKPNYDSYLLSRYISIKFHSSWLIILPLHIVPN